EILGAAVVVIGLPVHEAVVDQAADRGGDVGGAQEAQPSDLGDTAARVLGDELQHLDRGLGDVHIRARAAHEAARGGEEVEDAGRDFGDVDVREDFLRLVPADVGLGALGGGRCATHYCSSLLVL